MTDAEAIQIRNEMLIAGYYTVVVSVARDGTLQVSGRGRYNNELLVVHSMDEWRKHHPRS